MLFHGGRHDAFEAIAGLSRTKKPCKALSRGSLNAETYKLCSGGKPKERGGLSFRASEFIQSTQEHTLAGVLPETPTFIAVKLGHHNSIQTSHVYLQPASSI